MKLDNLTTCSTVVCTWLSSYGLTPKDLSGLSTRLIPTRPDLSTPTALYFPSHSRGLTIIDTLPSITDRTQTVAKLKRSVRSSPNCESIYIDPDLTPTEAKETAHLAPRTLKTQFRTPSWRHSESPLRYPLWKSGK